MILERETNRFRVSMNVREALEFQKQLADAIKRAYKSEYPHTESGPLIHRGDDGKAYPSVLLLTVDEKLYDRRYKVEQDGTKVKPAKGRGTEPSQFKGRYDS